MTEPLTERGRVSRRLIVEAAGELVAVRGIDGATVGDISARNSLTSGAFYRYFGGKRALLHTVYEDFVARLLEELSEPAARGDLYAFTRAWLDASVVAAGAIRVREELLSTDPEFVVVWRKYRPRLESLAAQAVADRYRERPAFAIPLVVDALEHQTRVNAMGWRHCGNERFAAAMEDVVENSLYVREAKPIAADGPRRRPVDYRPALEWTHAGTKRAPTSPRGKRTVEKIQQAAEKVFASKGIAGATIRDIAEVAGISAGSAYQYFSDKEQLFISMAVVAERAIIQGSLLPLDDRGVQDFVNTYLGYIEVFRERPGTFRAWWDFADPTTEPARAWGCVRTHFLDNFARVVEYGQRRGAARRKADPWAVAEIYADLHERIAYRHLVTRDIDVPDREIADFLDGLFRRVR